MQTDDATLIETLLPPELARELGQPAPAQAALAEGCARLEAALAALLPFVPPPVLDLQRRQPAHDLAAGRYMHGTSLAIELVGLRARSSQLAAAGRQGTEELTLLLNGLLAGLQERIAEHGGGIIKFGGETLTAFFDAAQLGRTHARQAAAAALALRGALGDAHELGLRAAIHAGKLFAIEVGDASHRKCIFTGYASNRLALALDASEPGQVVATEETLRSLRGAQLRHKLGDLHLLEQLDGAAERAHAAGNPPSQPSPEHLRELLARIAALRSYLPFGLPERFLEPHGERGEFRPVAVLFADFYALRQLLSLLELPALVEHDTTIVGQVLNTYYLRTQAIIHRHGGSISSIDMASFGNRLMALFGAPIAYGDDTERAVEAALALREASGAINAEISELLQTWLARYPEHRALLRLAGAARSRRIGVASDTLFAGLLGTPSRHDYTVLGPAVHLAARLLARAAEGEVLLAPEAQRVAGHLIDAAPRPPLPDDAGAGEIAVVQATRRPQGDRERAAPRRTTPLVGRRAELEQIDALAQRALGGAGQVVALVGEPGVGKSRLVGAALERLRQRQGRARVIATGCQSYEQTTPYAAVGRLLSGLLHIPDASDSIKAAAVQGQVVALAPPLARFTPLLGPLLRLALPENELVRSLSPEQRHDRLHDLVVTLCLSAAHAQPLVLAVDDLQWADSSSRELLARLAAALGEHPLLLLILAYRQEPAIAEPWAGHAWCTRVALGPLSPSESQGLAWSLLGGPPPAAVLPLIERSYGTPLFLEETLHYLIDRGLLQRNSSGAWVCSGPIEGALLPNQIEQVITARLDRISAPARSTLQAAAVFGMHFSAALLRATEAAAALEESLGELRDAALIVDDGPGQPPSYRFAHGLVRDVIYNSMLFARRRELHGRAARAIAAARPAADHQRVVLAQHYYHAEEWEPALLHLREAARQAEVQYASQEALALYEQALTVLRRLDEQREQPDHAAAADILAHIGDILALTGRCDEARASYERVLPLYGGPAAQVSLAAVQRKIGSTYEQQGDYAAALVWLTQAAASAGALDTAEARAEHASALSDIGNVYLHQGDPEQAQQHLERALQRTSPAQDDRRQAAILNRLGGVAWMRGNLDQARLCVEQSAAASRRTGDLVGQTKSLINLGLIAERQSALADSIRFYRQAIKLSERIGSARDQAIATNNLGWAYYGSEDYQQALLCFEQAIQHASSVRDTTGLIRAWLGLGSTYAALGEPQAAYAAVERSQALAQQAGRTAELLEGYVVLGEVALQQGDWADASAAHARGLQLGVEQESAEYGWLQRLEAQILKARGEAGRAVALLEENLALFERLQDAPEAARTRRLLDALSGDLVRHRAA